MDRTTAAQLLSFLAVEYPQEKIDDVRIRMWAELLSDIEFVEASEAALAWLKSGQARFFPKAGQLRDIALQNRAALGFHELAELPGPVMNRAEWQPYEVRGLRWRGKIVHPTGETCSWFAHLRDRVDIEICGEAIDGPTAYAEMRHQMERAGRFLDSCYPPMSAAQLKVALREMRVTG